MALLIADDFTNEKVKVEVTRVPAYLDNDLVTQYWYNLASKYSVPTDALPAEDEIQSLVKQYLINEVTIHVANDNIGSNLKQVAEGIVTDQWELLLVRSETRRQDLINQMSADFIYDPANIPEDTTGSNITRWNRG